MTIKISRRLLDTNQITYLKSEINYCRIYFEDGTGFLSAFTLTKILKLVPDYFIQIHRGLAVNPKFTQYFQGNCRSGYVRLLSGEQFTVSRRKAAKVKEIFKQFKGQ